MTCSFHKFGQFFPGTGDISVSITRVYSNAIFGIDYEINTIIAKCHPLFLLTVIAYRILVLVRGNTMR